MDPDFWDKTLLEAKIRSKLENGGAAALLDAQDGGPNFELNYLLSSFEALSEKKKKSAQEKKQLEEEIDELKQQHEVGFVQCISHKK